MSTADESHVPDERASAPDEAEAHDYLLDFFMDFVVGLNDEYEEGTASVILSVSGGLVSGQIVARKVWFGHVADQVGQSSEGAGDGLRKLFGHLEEKLHEVPEDERRRGYIHLTDAYLIGAGNQVTSLGLWRGRLSQVSGWSLGSRGQG